MESTLPSSSIQMESIGMDQPPQLIPFAGNPCDGQKENAPILEPFSGCSRPYAPQIAPKYPVKRAYRLVKPQLFPVKTVSQQGPLKSVFGPRKPVRGTIDASIDSVINSSKTVFSQPIQGSRVVRKVPVLNRRPAVQMVGQDEDSLSQIPNPRFHYPVYQVRRVEMVPTPHGTKSVFDPSAEMVSGEPPVRNLGPLRHVPEEFQVPNPYQRPRAPPVPPKKKRAPRKKKQQVVEYQPTEFYPVFQQEYMDYPEYYSEEFQPDFQQQYMEPEGFYPINQEVYEEEVVYPDIEPILDELLSKGPVLNEEFLKREQNEFCWMLGLPPMHIEEPIQLD